MNAFGEPNMGNPSVRFDEGRERVGHWPVRLSIQPLPPTLQENSSFGSSVLVHPCKSVPSVVKSTFLFTLSAAWRDFPSLSCSSSSSSSILFLKPGTDKDEPFSVA